MLELRGGAVHRDLGTLLRVLPHTLEISGALVAASANLVNLLDLRPRPGALTVVGDPKQSIYRFRRAEPQVFKAAQQFVRQGLDGELLSCDHTRRNAQAVIRTVNAVMGAARANDGTMARARA